MAWMFSNSLLADAIWLEAKRQGITIDQVAREMSEASGLPVTRERLCRLRSTDVHPKVDSLAAMLNWLGRWDMAEFLVDTTTLEVDSDGRITIERMAWPQHPDHRVTIGRMK